MQHLILRCKHCHKEYTYCTYGNGPEFGTEEGCSREYCADCQKAIDNALSKIPVGYSSKYMEIHDSRIFEMFERVKQNYKEAVAKNPMEGLAIETLSMSLYDNTETYIHDGIKYKVEWDDETPEDKHVFIYAEFNLTTQKFTGKPWKVLNDSSDYYSHRRCLKLKRREISTQQIGMCEPPVGKLYYFDFVDEKITVNEKKPGHIKRTYTSDITGDTIKVSCENGTYNFDKSLDMTNLENILTYECTFEKYDDEDKSTLIGIKVK